MVFNNKLLIFIFAILLIGTVSAFGVNDARVVANEEGATSQSADGIGQSFTVGVGGFGWEYNLSGVSFKNFATATGTTCNVTLWDGNLVNASRTALSSDTTACSNLVGGGQFNMTLPTVTLVDDHIYAFGVVSDTGTINLMAESSEGYAGGNDFFSTDVGATWTEQSIDLNFVIYGTPNIPTSWENNLNRELVAYYDLNEASHPAIDLVSGTYNGTEVSTVTENVAGINGTAYSYSSTSATLLPDMDEIEGNPTLSFNVWINYTGGGTPSDSIIRKSGEPATDVVFSLIQRASGQASCQMTNVATTVADSGSTSGDYGDGNWHMLTCVYDGTNVKIYLDGVLENSASLTGNIKTSNQNITIGGLGADDFVGTLDEVGFWSKDLSEDEISQLYNFGSSIAWQEPTPYNWTNNLHQGLAVYYDFEDGGNTLTDATGKYNASSIATVTPNQTGINGNSFLYNAVGRNQFGDVTEMDEVGAYTVNIWIKNPAGTPPDAIVERTQLASGGNTAIKMLSRPSGEIECQFFNSSTGGNSAGITSGAGADDGEWHMITCLYDGSELKTYIDGVKFLNTSASGTIAPTSQNFSLAGRRTSDGVDNWAGELDEFGMWSRGLSEEELFSLYNLGNSITFQEPTPFNWGSADFDSGLVAFWDFEEGSGSLAEDITGNPIGLNGTLNNMEGGDWVTGVIGTGLYFDSSDTESVTTSNNLGITGSSDRTVCAWADMNNDGGAEGLVGWGVNSNYQASVLGTNTGNDRIVFYGHNNEHYGTNGLVTYTGFQFYCFTYTNNVGNLYIDGELDKSFTPTVFATTDTIVTMGKNPTAISWAMNGTLDNVMIWDRVLPEDEIWKLNNFGDSIIYGSTSEDIIAPVVSISFPVNATNYFVNVTELNYTVSDEILLDSCWYSLDSGATNVSTTCNVDLTGLTSVEGSNTWTVYANDSSNNLGYDAVTFLKDTSPPVINLTNPADAIHTNVIQNFTATITDGGGIVNSTLYILNSSNDLIFSQFTAHAGNPTSVNIGTEYNLSIAGVYTWYYNATDTTNDVGTVAEFTITWDAITPFLNWYTPSAPVTTASSPYTINVSATDTYLDATNVTVYNEGGSVIYTNFSGNLTTSIFWMYDPVTLNEGLNTLEICARDSLESSPVIEGTTNFTKRNAEETEYVMPDGNVVVRELVIKDEFNNKLSAEFVNLVTTEEWVDGGRHFKTTWEFDDIGAGFMEVVMYDDNGDLELLTDRGVTRVVDRERNYYWSYGDMESAGFELEYDVKEDGQIEIKATKGTYDNAGGRWVVDPIVAGLNTICSNETIRLDTTAPTTQTGGGGGTSPQNNSYTNESATNFTINASDVGGIDNVTFFIVNESDDIIFNETFTGGGATNIFFGFLYNLWYEGVYKWYYTVVDSIGNSIDSVVNLITFDATSPNITFTTSSITNVSTDTLPANISINYFVNDTNLNTCYYMIDGGANLTLNCSGSSANISVSTEGHHNLTIQGIDLAGNSEEDTLPFYIFYHTFNQSTVAPITSEGSVVTFNIFITQTDYGNTIGYLNYDGIEYLADSFNIVGNNISLTKALTIPDGTGNTTGKETNWNWKYSIEGNSFWEENYTTTNSSQTVFSVDIDDCSTFNDVILHYDLNDEATDIAINTSINGTLNPVVEAEVDIISLGDPDLTWSFNQTFTDTNGSICITSGILNYSDYRFDAVVSYIADTYAQEFWYLDNGTLSLGESTLNDFTNINVTFRDLLLDDSSTFLFKYYDENYLVHPEDIVILYRKYIGEGVFKEAERCKLDNNGECHLHLVEEDVIYKFTIVDEGGLEFNSGEYNAKCLETVCSITLQKGVGVQEWDTEFDALPEGTYDLNSDKNNRTVTLSFNLDETGTMQLDVYAYSNVIQSPDTLVATDTATAKSGTIEVTVPLSYGNQTYYAVVRHDDGFVSSAWIDMNESGFNYFGNLGLFLGALLVLTLGLIAVSSGGWTIAFLILGLLVASITKLVDMDFYLLMWVISAGGLIIWKLSTRRSI